MTCYKQTSSTFNVVDDSAYSSASAPSWTQTTVHKYSVVRRQQETSGPVEKRNFTHPPAFGAPVGGDPIGISSRSFGS